MKKAFILISLMYFSITAFSQKKNVDTSNYYNYLKTDGVKGKKLMVKWLHELEIAQIIFEEMTNAGYKIIQTNVIIKLDTGKYVVAICYSEKSKFGFVYEDIHGIINTNKDRYIKSNTKAMLGFDYSEKILEPDGKSEFIKIQTLPDNLYLIKEDLYWYEETENPSDDKILLTRKDIIEILRKDIRYVLSKAPKP